MVEEFFDVPEYTRPSFYKKHLEKPLWAAIVIATMSGAIIARNVSKHKQTQKKLF